MTPKTILTVSVTEAGRAVARRLPFEHVHGDAAATIAGRWADVDAFVLVLAVGAAVRMIAPLLTDKEQDPAVVCVDDAGRYAVAVLGGHGAGANDLAHQVAAVTGAEPVVTTASDRLGVPALDQLPGFVASGDVAPASRALLDGSPVAIDNHLGWPLPELLTGATPAGATPAGQRRPTIRITDASEPRQAGTAVLHPPTLVVGVGTSTGATPDDLAQLVTAAIAGAGLATASVGMVATIDRRRTHRAVVSLGWPIEAFAAPELAEVAVPHPSDAVRQAVGSPSVAEAAALLAAGPGSTLVVPKQASGAATVAIARRARPRGRLHVVGLGPGGAEHRTPAAAAAVRHAEVVVGYSAYVDQCADLIGPQQHVVRSPLGAELDRAQMALEAAADGKQVALVCSGDPGIYAMASPVLELAGRPDLAAVQVVVVPGVTASLAAAAVLGAPLGHDHAVISLSDLLTPWEVVGARVEAVAAADLVAVFYNPRSERRQWQLPRAMEILAKQRPRSTPVGLVTDAGRVGTRHQLTTIHELDPEEVTMTTCLVVGASTTVVRRGRMVTPRGYPL